MYSIGMMDLICFNKLTLYPLFFLLGSCRNWRRKKERKRRSGWSSRGKGERGTKSGSVKGSAETVKKRRKGRGRGTRSGKETETGNENGKETGNGRGRRRERGRGRGTGVAMSARTEADPGQSGPKLSHLLHASIEFNSHHK